MQDSSAIEANDVIEQKQEEISELLGRLDQVQSHCDQLSAECESVTKKHAALAEEHLALSLEHQSLMSKHSEEFADLLEQHELLYLQYDQKLAEEHLRSESTETHHIEQTANLEKQLQTLTNHNTELTQLVQKANQSEFKKLNLELSDSHALEADFLALQKSHAALQSDRDSLQGAYDALCTEHDEVSYEYQTVHKAMIAQIDTLTLEKFEMKKERDALTAKLQTSSQESKLDPALITLAVPETALIEWERKYEALQVQHRALSLQYGILDKKHEHVHRHVILNENSMEKDSNQQRMTVELEFSEAAFLSGSSVVATHIPNRELISSALNNVNLTRGEFLEAKENWARYLETIDQEWNQRLLQLLIKGEEEQKEWERKLKLAICRIKQAKQREQVLKTKIKYLVQKFADSKPASEISSLRKDTVVLETESEESDLAWNLIDSEINKPDAAGSISSFSPPNSSPASLTYAVAQNRTDVMTSAINAVDFGASNNQKTIFELAEPEHHGQLSQLVERWFATGIECEKLHMQRELSDWETRLTTQLHQVRAQLANSQETNEELNKRLAKYSAARSKLREQTQEVISELRVAKNEAISLLEEQVNDLKSEIQEMREEKDILESEFKEDCIALKKIISKKDTKIAKLKLELLTKALKQSEAGRLQRSSNEPEQLLRDIHNLENNLDTTMSHKATLSNLALVAVPSEDQASINEANEIDLSQSHQSPPATNSMTAGKNETLASVQSRPHKYLMFVLPIFFVVL